MKETLIVVIGVMLWLVLGALTVGRWTDYAAWSALLWAAIGTAGVLLAVNL